MKIFTFLLLLISILVGCSNGEKKPVKASAPPDQENVSSGSMPLAPASSGFRSINPHEAKNLMESREDILIVDVREPQELREGKIAGSYLVPFWSILRGQHNLPQDKALLVVCAVGGRSYAAGQIFMRQGFREIYNLSGGIAAWKSLNMPLQ